MNHIIQRAVFVLFIFFIGLSACSQTVENVQSESTNSIEITIPSKTTTATMVRTHTLTITPSVTLTNTPEPTHIATATPIPTYTYITLRGKVIVDQAVCHYGPGAPYLYKYGVYRDSNLEIIRRVELGNYVEIQAIGGNNPCWVKDDYLDINGDIENLEPVSAKDVKLPRSPFYENPGGVSASRNGNEVSIFWEPLYLRLGDDSEQLPYVVESWVCQNGEFFFNPVGTYQTSIIIVDEPGCPQESHARMLAAEKHGYTWPVDIPWPPAEGENFEEE